MPLTIQIYVLFYQKDDQTIGFEFQNMGGLVKNYKLYNFIFNNNLCDLESVLNLNNYTVSSTEIISCGYNLDGRL
ncbi:MAG: hypothetical protein B6244_00865 [Candidatus Cloacimonetes bacterium 4572_55]|nr:MAG: hypothetical protein B6244_00865 [Candidatus Cloacimonetes bacterium 4572_55]